MNNETKKNEIITLCRIKVNKMLSTLNTTKNKNIFIPKYTLTNKSEKNYFSNFNNKNMRQKQKPNNKNKKENLNNDKSLKNKNIDFIINKGVLVYQRNMKGEEVINFGINQNYLNKDKNDYNDIVYKTETNFNKKIKNKSKEKTMTKTNSFHNNKKLSNFNEHNKKNNITGNIYCLYNKDNKENQNYLNINNNINKKNKNLKKTRNKNLSSCLLKTNNNNSNYQNNLKSELNYKIIYLYLKIKKLYEIRLKNYFQNIKYYYPEYTEIKKDADEIILPKTVSNFKNKNLNNITNHKKSNSIIVNKILPSSSITSRTTTNTKNNFIKSKNLSFLISKNYQFFSKEKDKKTELYRDSKSLEKKYEQICRRKNLNMTMTYANGFRNNNIINLDESNNYLSEINKTNSFSNFYENSNDNSYKNNDKIIYKNRSNIYNIDANIRNNKEINIFVDNDVSKANLNLKNYNNQKTNIRMKKNISFNDTHKKKSKANLLVIKNISTKDKRIFIHIKYIPYIIDTNSNKNIDINKSKKLRITKIFNFNYISKNNIKKKIIKSKTNLKNKLSLIKEEDEKSKINIKEDIELNSYKKIHNKISIFNHKELYVLFISKLIKIFEKNINQNKYIFFQKLNKNKNIKELKIEKLEEHIANIIIKDKIYMNNIFINDKNLFSSHSLDLGKDFKIIDSSLIKNDKGDTFSKDNIN